MSAKVCGLIWEVGPQDRMQRFVLLAIGDNAGDDGFCYPGIKLLASKCLFTERYVMQSIQQLEIDGWLRVDRKAHHGKGNEYQIDIEKLEQLKDELRSREKSSREKKSGEIHDNAQVKSTTDSGEIHDITILKNHQEPSMTRQEIVREIFSYYCSADRMDRNPLVYSLTPLRLEKGLARLKDALKKTYGDIPKAIELMKAVVDEVFFNDFLMGRDVKSNGKRYCEWEEHLFRSTEQFEKRLQQSHDNALMEAKRG